MEGQWEHRHMRVPLASACDCHAPDLEGWASCGGPWPLALWSNGGGGAKLVLNGIHHLHHPPALCARRKRSGSAPAGACPPVSDSRERRGRQHSARSASEHKLAQPRSQLMHAHIVLLRPPGLSWRAARWRGGPTLGSPVSEGKVPPLRPRSNWVGLADTASAYIE